MPADRTYDEWTEVPASSLSLDDMSRWTVKEAGDLLSVAPMRQEADGSWRLLYRFREGGQLEVWYADPNKDRVLRFAPDGERFERNGDDLFVSSARRS